MSVIDAGGVSAIRVSSVGGPEVLAAVEIELPALEAGEARVAVSYAGVNFWDVMQRRGEVPLVAPGISGVEGVGVVTAVGDPTADGGLVGARVAWSRVPGSYATEVQTDVDRLVRLPDEVSDELAAAAMMQGITALNLLEAAPVMATGAAVLVHAAAGGVGTLLTQLLAHDGVRVVGVVGDPRKREAALAAGASVAVVDGEDLVERVQQVAPEGVAVVFDGNGGPAVARAFEVLAPRGALVVFGTAAGPLPTIDLALLGAGSFTVTRVAGKHFVAGSADWRQRATRVLAAVAQGVLKPVVAQILPLEQAAEAHRLLEDRHTVGKLLLRTARGRAHVVN